MGKPIIGGTDRNSPKEKAARVVAHPAAKAPCDALCDGNLKTNDRSAPCANDERFSTSSEEFAAAFPGQSVRAGIPNRMRRAMHCARGLIRAVERNDIDAAVVWMRALDRATAPIAKSERPS